MPQQWSRDAQNYFDEMSKVPGVREPATIGEIWDSERKRGGLDTITGLGKPLRDATDELQTAIETHSQRPLRDYASQMRIPLAGGTVDQTIKALNDLADTLPDEAKAKIEPLRDVRRNAQTKAQKIERDAADVASATYGLGGHATAWAAGTVSQMSDPVNIALMLATATIGGPLTAGAAGAAKFIGWQGLGAAGAQFAVEPFIEPARAELGLESGFGRAAGNIFEAGVGGAVLAGGGVALYRLFRAAADSYRVARPADAAVQPPATGLTSDSPGATAGPSVAARTGDDVFGAISAGQQHPNLTSEDFAAAALHAERDSVTAAPQGADPVAHAEGLAQARQAMERGRPALSRDPADEKYGFTPSQMKRLLDEEQEQLINMWHQAKEPISPEASDHHRSIMMAYQRELDRAGIWQARTEDEARDILFEKRGERVKATRPETVDGQSERAPALQPKLPPARPIEPRGPPIEVKEPTDLGSPVLASDLEGRLAKMPDAETQVFHIGQPDGTVKSGSAKSLLKEAADDARAVKELIDCIGQEPK